MVRLVPMTDAEFQTYLEFDIQRYAEGQVKAGNWDAAEALEKSRRDHQQLLPDGLATRNHHLFSLEDEDTGSKVGMIWFALDDQEPHRTAYVYDFIIHDEFRRRGYGTQALQALEIKVKELGINKISLHVFEHNHAARALYEKVGYEITGLDMLKRLS